MATGGRPHQARVYAARRCMRDLAKLTGRSLEDVAQLRMQHVHLDPRDVARAAAAHGVPERQLGDQLRWGAIVWPDPAGGAVTLEGLSAAARGLLDWYLDRIRRTAEAPVWLFPEALGTGMGTAAQARRIRPMAEATV